MSKSLVIRADATREMGTGHVMRTIALAQKWQELGYGKTVLAGYIDTPRLCKIIKNNVDKLIKLSTPNDLHTFVDFLDSCDNPGWCVIDGYHFRNEYIEQISSKGWRLLLIDDLCDRYSYSADVVLNGNFYAKELQYPPSPKVHYLLGPQYALLRKEFSSARSICTGKCCPNTAKKLLITLGGSDIAKLTPLILKALSFIKDLNFEIKVVIGPASSFTCHSFYDDSFKHSVEFIYGTENMADLMSWADMAISAGGSTCLELACMGVPFLVTEVADNQKKVVNWLVRQGLAKNIYTPGNYNNLEDIGFIIRSFASDKNKRQQIQDRLISLVDGQGSMRAVRFMAATMGDFRSIRPEDKELLFIWRNEKSMRNVSRSTKPITWQEHCAWFQKVLTSDDIHIYVATDINNNPWGQIRFETKRRVVEVSCYIDLAFRGVGLGKELIMQGTQIFLNRKGRTQDIIAYVKRTNFASIQAFKRAGYENVKNKLINGHEFIIFRYDI